MNYPTDHKNSDLPKRLHVCFLLKLLPGKRHHPIQATEQRDST